MVNVAVQVLKRERRKGLDPFDRVRDRAYELYCLRGGESGHEHEDWLRAEREVLCGGDTQILETSKGWRLLCRLPGFEADQIRVWTEGGEIVVEAESKGETGDVVIRNVYRRMKPLNSGETDQVTAQWDGEMLDVEVAREATGLPACPIEEAVAVAAA